MKLRHVLGAASLVVWAAAAAAPQESFDVLIRGGTIIDGSGRSPYVGDIGVKGDRVVAIGQLDRNKARTVVDARGKAVSPGFINTLSQSGESLLYDGRGASDLAQGVTLEVLGEGDSLGPLNAASRAELIRGQSDFHYPVDWTTLGEGLEKLVAHGVALNVASFVGAATIRVHELGYANRAPTAPELARMQELVRQAMREGAVGLGSALIYAPGAYARTDELIALAKAASELKGVYSSHVRSEGDRFLEGLDELIEISREAHIPAEIHHMKAAGRANWPKMSQAIARVEAARASGLHITANMYPYTAGETGLDASMPTWVQEGGFDAWAARLKDPSVRARVIEEMRAPGVGWENMMLAAGSPDNILLVGFKNPKLKPLTGQTLGAVARAGGRSAEDTAIDLVIEDQTRVTTVYFVMSEDNVKLGLSQPWVSLDSDESAVAPEGIFLLSSPHPRAYGAFARFLGKYVREEKVTSLPDAIRRMTRLPAANFGLRERGCIDPGCHADIVIFDPNTIADHATFEKPRQFATGVAAVFVNGVEVFKNGKPTGAKPGQVVRGAGWSGWQSAAPTLEQVRNYAFPEGLVSSAKGSHLAWGVSERGRRNIWVAAGPDFQPRQLTNYADDDGQELSSISLSADGRYVVYVRGGDHGANWDAGSPANPQSLPTGPKVEVWSVPFSGGPLHRLGEGDLPVIAPDGSRVVYLKDGAAWLAPIDGSAEAQKILAIRGRVQSPTWSPDGKQLAFVAARETHSFIGIYSGAGTPIRWVAPAFNRDDSPQWSPDGRRLAFIRGHGDGGEPHPLLDRRPEPWSIWVADAASGEAKLWWSSGTTLRDSRTRGGLFDWASDGHIVFESYQDGWPHLYSLAGAGATALQLTRGEFEVENANLNADRTRVIFQANTGPSRDDGDRVHIYEVSVAQAGARALTSGSGLEWSPAVTGDGQVAFISATAQRPPSLALATAESAAPRLLATGTNVSYPSERLVVPRRVTFQSADGLTVHGQLFEPPGGGRHPAILYLHGGPKRQMLLGWHPMDYYSNDYAFNQYLAMRGFVVLALNYRLGTHYGHDFEFPARAGMRGASEYQDVKAAGLYLKSLPAVDAARVGLYGGSYGGYLTAMGLAHDSDLFKAGVDIHGVHDWSAREELSWPFNRKRYEVAPDLQQAVETAWMSSPASAVGSWRSPVLLIQGDDDRNVRFGQSVDLVQRLEERQVPVESLVFPDDTHAIWMYANELRMNQAAAEFLERHLLWPSR